LRSALERRGGLDAPSVFQKTFDDINRYRFGVEIDTHLKANIYVAIETTMALMSIVLFTEGKTIFTMPSSDEEIAETVTCMVEKRDSADCTEKDFGEARAAQLYSKLFMNEIEIRRREDGHKVEQPIVRLAFRERDFPSREECVTKKWPCIMTPQEFNEKWFTQKKIWVPKRFFKNVKPGEEVDLPGDASYAIVGIGVYKWMWILNTFSKCIFLAKRKQVTASTIHVSYVGTFMFFAGLNFGSIKDASDLISSELVFGKSLLAIFKRHLKDFHSVLPNTEDAHEKAMEMIQDCMKRLTDARNNAGVNKNFLEKIIVAIRESGFVEHLYGQLLNPDIATMGLKLYGFSLGAAQALVCAFVFETLIRGMLMAAYVKGRDPRDPSPLDPSIVNKKIEAVTFQVFGAPRMFNKPLARHLKDICHPSSFNVTLTTLRYKINQATGKNEAFVLPDPTACIPAVVSTDREAPQNIVGNVSPNILLLGSSPPPNNLCFDREREMTYIIGEDLGKRSSVRYGERRSRRGERRPITVDSGMIFGDDAGTSLLEAINCTATFLQSDGKSTPGQTLLSTLSRTLHNMSSYKDALLGTVPVIKTDNRRWCLLRTRRQRKSCFVERFKCTL